MHLWLTFLTLLLMGVFGGSSVANASEMVEMKCGHQKGAHIRYRRGAVELPGVPSYELQGVSIEEVEYLFRLALDKPKIVLLRRTHSTASIDPIRESELEVVSAGGGIVTALGRSAVGTELFELNLPKRLVVQAVVETYTGLSNSANAMVTVLDCEVGEGGVRDGL